jgi:hypothetical protein
VTYFLKAITVEPEKQPLLGKGSENMSVIRLWFSSRHVIAAGDAHAIEKWLEAVFSVRSAPRLYKEDQLPLRESFQTAVRGVGVWCETAASLRGLESGSRERSTIGRRYQAAQGIP